MRVASQMLSYCRVLLTNMQLQPEIWPWLASGAAPQPAYNPGYLCRHQLEELSWVMMEVSLQRCAEEAFFMNQQGS